MLGIVLPTCIGAAAVNAGLDRMQHVVRTLTPSSRFVIAGLIAAAAWGTARPLDLLAIEALAVAGVTVFVAWRDVEPLKVVLAATAAGVAWSLLTA